MTLHKFLGLWDVKKPIKSLIYMPYSKATAIRIRKLDFLLIDETCLIGAYFFNVLNHRLQLIRNNKKPFGGINLVCSLDSYQLTCVKDIPLTKEPKEVQDTFAKESLLLFQNPDFNYELTDQVRQKNDKRFEELLKNVRNKCMTDEDKRLFVARHETNLSNEELDSFSSAPVVFATNEQVDEYNQQTILNKNIPVRKICPVFTSYCEVCAKQYKSFYVGRHLKMQIIRNLAYDIGVANGTEILCVDAVYEGFDKQPSVIIVSCDDFRGKPLRSKKEIPITIYTESFFCSHLQIRVTCSFFPLVNNEASTFYRLQGASLPKLVIGLDGINKNSREFYVGVSRVKKISDLLFKSTRSIESFFI